MGGDLCCRDRNHTGDSEPDLAVAGTMPDGAFYEGCYMICANHPKVQAEVARERELAARADEAAAEASAAKAAPSGSDLVGMAMAGNKSARRILEAIAGGERDPGTLAALAHAGVKGGRDGIRASLEGMMPGEHHLMLIRTLLGLITGLDREIGALEDEISAQLATMADAWGVTADGVPSPDPGPGPAVLPAAERLAEVPGISADLATAIIAETGLDMTRFPTAAHLASWAGLSPVAQQSGRRQQNSAPSNPPRAAHSHSASVGRLCFAHAAYASASSNATCTTG